MKAYKCIVEFDNGARVKTETLIVFTDDSQKVNSIVVDMLCKHNDDFVSKIESHEIDVKCGDAFVLASE